MVGVVTIGDVDGPAEITEERAVSKGSILVKKGKRRSTLHLWRWRNRKVVQEGSGEIRRLRQGSPPRPGAALTARIVDKERDVHDLFVHVHAVLRPEIVFAKKKAVVGGDNKGGIVPKVCAIEVVEQLAE